MCWPTRPGIKGRGAPRGGAEAGGSVLAAPRRRPGRMRLAVRALLACAVLGECGSRERARSRRPRRPGPAAPATHPLGSAPGWKHRRSSLAPPRCTPAPALALPEGQRSSGVPLPRSMLSLLPPTRCPGNLAVAECNK